MIRIKPALDQPTIFLRLEGALILVASTVLCFQLDVNWWLFPVFWLIVDISAIGYLAGPKIGAAVYNLAHTSIIPLALIAYVLATPLTNHSVLELLVAIWLNHVGFDRMMGYGLKFSTSFQDTNLGHIGRK